MKKLVQSTQYKKDLKRIRNDAKKAEALLGILTKLENEIPIPSENRPHLLTGDFIYFISQNLISLVNQLIKNI